MNVITYRILLEQPLLATQLPGDPNSSLTFPYLPGSLVRGMLIHRYRQGRPTLTEDAVALDADCRRLFFSGETRFLHAYPLMEGEQRCLPTPLMLLRRKGDAERGPVFNASHVDFDRDEAEAGDTLKSTGSVFCLLAGEEVTLCEPRPNRLTVHVARAPKAGRATAADGAIFQYEALSAGQWFGGIILAASSEEAATLKELLPGPAWLGRSRSAGYGQVRIELADDPSDQWREVGKAAELSAGQPVTMTLLSDAILRDATGAYALTLSQPVLEAYLGVTIAVLHPDRSFSVTTVSGGFNRTGHTPLAQSYALAAGSTVTFEPARPLTVDLLTQLEAQGIGERRAEGFGRIAFGWCVDQELTPMKGEPFTLRQRPDELAPASRAMARQMAHRLLTQEIEERVARFVRDQVASHAAQFPANSQLGRVRVLLRRAAREGSQLNEVNKALAAFKAASRQQFERTRISKVSLWDWLTSLLAAPATRDVWDELELPHDRWPRVAGERAEADATLIRTVTLQLVEATLTAASRERKRTEGTR